MVKKKNKMGKGGAKRYRKVIRDYIQGTTNSTIRRLARQSGVKRFSGFNYKKHVVS